MWSRLRFFFNVVFCRLGNLQRPLFVVLVTNNKCNLSCKYCYGEYGERSHYKDYTTKELLEIIDKLWEMGCRNFTVHGGESLLRKDIGHLLNYMKLKGFYVSLNTNGILIPHKIDEVRCVDTICISLDGAEESHDRNRGKGSFKSAMRAIEVIRENNIPLVIHSTLTRHNMDDMEFLAQKGSELGFRVQFSILYNRGGLEETDILSDREVREVIKKVLELKRMKYPIYYSEGVLASALNWPLPLDKRSFISKSEWNEELSFKEQIECYHGLLKYQIDADGRVVTCWGHDDKDAPNIKEVGVEKAIQQCSEHKDCKYCTFLANNEHNLMFGFNLRTLMDLVSIQIGDALKIKKRNN